jgi:hypothetical protein
VQFGRRCRCCGALQVGCWVAGQRRSVVYVLPAVRIGGDPAWWRAPPARVPGPLRTARTRTRARLLDFDGAVGQRLPERCPIRTDVIAGGPHLRPHSSQGQARAAPPPSAPPAPRIMSRPDVLNVARPTPRRVRDLHRCGSRGRLHRPHVRYGRQPRNGRLVRTSTPSALRNPRSTDCGLPRSPNVAQLRLRKVPHMYHMVRHCHAPTDLPSRQGWPPKFRLSHLRITELRRRMSRSS